MEIWIIYDRPKDFPDRYVARKYRARRPTNEIILSQDLEDLRSRLPPGLVKLDRMPGDDRKILETWL